MLHGFPEGEVGRGAEEDGGVRIDLWTPFPTSELEAASIQCALMYQFSIYDFV